MVERRRPHVGIDDQGAAALPRDDICQGMGRGRFAFARFRACDRQGARQAMVGREAEVRQHRQTRFDKVRFGIAKLDERIGRCTARDRAEHREADPVLDFGRIVQRLVHLRHQQRQTTPENGPDHQSEQQVEERPRAGRVGRHKRPIDDQNVVLADAAGDTDLLVALEQAVIQFAVGVHVALEDVVLDPTPTLVEDRLLEILDALVDRSLALDALLIGTLHG